MNKIKNWSSVTYKYLSCWKKLLENNLVLIVPSQQTEMDAVYSDNMNQGRKFSENFEKLQSELLLGKWIL